MFSERDLSTKEIRQRLKFVRDIITFLKLYGIRAFRVALKAFFKVTFP